MEKLSRGRFYTDFDSDVVVFVTSVTEMVENGKWNGWQEFLKTPQGMPVAITYFVTVLSFVPDDGEQ